MARQPRIEYEGAFYHVTSRGNLGDKIFFRETDRTRMIEILKECIRDQIEETIHNMAVSTVEKFLNEHPETGQHMNLNFQVAITTNLLYDIEGHVESENNNKKRRKRELKRWKRK